MTGTRSIRTLLALLAALTFCGVASQAARASNTTRLRNYTRDTTFYLVNLANWGACTEFRIPGGQRVGAELRPGQSAEFVQEAGNIFRGCNSPASYLLYGLYKPESEQISVFGYDPTVGPEQRRCSIVGQPATFLRATLQGENCTISNTSSRRARPGKPRPGKAVDARFTANTATVSGRRVLVPIELYGGAATGHELVELDAPDGRVLGRTTGVFGAGHPISVPVTIDCATSRAVASPGSSLSVRARIRHLRGTSGTGYTADLILSSGF